LWVLESVVHDEAIGVDEKTDDFTLL